MNVRYGPIAIAEPQIPSDGYLLHSGSPYILWSGNAGVCVAYDHRFVRDWVDGHSLLEESVEELAPATRFPPIEAEGELV